MKLPKYILASNRESLPAPVILQTEPPYIFCLVRMEKKQTDFLEWIASYKGLHYSVIDGYNIAVYFAGTLTGRLDVTPDYLERLKIVIEEMKQFYIRERINHKPEFYKKYATA